MSTSTFKKILYIKRKGKNPKKLTTQVVYSINCKCCPAVHIGQSKQYLNNRLTQYNNNNNNKK